MIETSGECPQVIHQVNAHVALLANWNVAPELFLRQQSKAHTGTGGYFTCDLYMIPVPAGFMYGIYVRCCVFFCIFALCGNKLTKTFPDNLPRAAVWVCSVVWSRCFFFVHHKLFFRFLWYRLVCRRKKGRVASCHIIRWRFGAFCRLLSCCLYGLDYGTAVILNGAAAMDSQFFVYTWYNSTSYTGYNL